MSGPIARTVADVALFLSAIAGPDDRSPLSIAQDPAMYRAPLERDFKGVRVAWWRGLGGLPGAFADIEVMVARRSAPVDSLGRLAGDV